MIINIRGTNGSGKSTLVRGLLERSGGKPLYGALGPRKAEAYELKVLSVKRSVYVLGSYHTASGGCDQIQPYDLILELINKYVPKGHLIFEGVLISDHYGRVGELLSSYGKDVVVGFMTTPLEICLSNIAARRRLVGNVNPVKSQHTSNRYARILKLRQKLITVGVVQVVDIDPLKGFEQLVVLLRGV